MPIAVIGIAARVPGADDYHRYWRNLLNGVDSIGAVPTDRWQADGPASEGLGDDARRAMGFGGFVEGIDLFDGGFFGIAAAEAAKMDPKQRLALECAWRAMEDAGLTADDLRGTDTGVFVGTSVYDYYELLMQDPRNVDGYVGVGNFNCIVPNRISYLLDLHGPSIAIETACSASMTALHLACQSIRSGECEQAFAGGAMVMLSPYVTRNFASGNFLSPRGRCHAFGARADGYVRGEGAGIVLLKPLSAARQAGDHVHAVVLGTACNQDGRSNGLTAPNPLAQERLLRRAYAAAGVAPAAIGYVEAHGTGTPLGDPIEAKALGKVLGEARDSKAPCMIGSVKSNIGHLEAAAGIAGFIKAVLAVEHGVIPATLHAEPVNPGIDLAALKLAVPTAAQPWSDDQPRLAGISSFSFGGSNVHAVIANTAPPDATEIKPWPLETLVLSARSAEALELLADATAGALRGLDGAAAFAALCSAAARGRKSYRHRLALVAADAAAAATLLERRQDGPAGLWRGEATGRAAKVVLAFSGQGVDLVGAGEDLRAIPAFRDTFTACEAAVAGHVDVPLEQCLWGERTDLLADTRYAQPASLAFSLALHAVWRSWGVPGAVMLGHSLGEYAAAVVAGVFTAGDAMRLVAARGAAMAAMEPGGMAALHCTPETARALTQAHPALSVAAENAEQLTIVSGPDEALAILDIAAAAAGVAAQRLPAARAFHSACVDPVLAALVAAADAIPAAAPRATLISNVTAMPMTVAPDPAYWAEHARRPVCFAECLAAARAAGGNVVLEIGPGRTLSGLARRHPAWAGCDPIASLSQPDAGRAGLAAALAQLFVTGVALDWDAIFADRPRRHDALPGHPFMRTRHWFEHPDRRQLSPPAPSHERRWVIEAHERDLMAQHLLNGRPVMPAASIIGYMLATVNDRGAPRLTDLSLLVPLPVPAHGPLWFTIAVDPAGGADRRRIRLIGDDGIIHARGFCQGDDAGETAIAALATIADLPRSDGAVEIRYASLARQGIVYGPAFRTLHSLAMADGTVVATVSSGPEPDQPPMLATAALLDGCFQALGRDTGQRAYIPVHVDMIEAAVMAGSPASVTAYLMPVDDDEAVVADLDIADAEGRPAMRIRGLRLQAIGDAARLPFDRSMLLLPIWREVAPPPGPLPDRSTAAAVAELASSAKTLAAALDLSGYVAALDALDRRASRAAGEFAASGGTPSTAHGRALARRFAGMAASLDGVPEPSYIADTTEDRATVVEARTLARCIAALPEVLAGGVDPLIPLFAGDGADVMAIYEDTPAARYFNRLCGEVTRATAVAAGRRLRVLEVGAGTCATTRAILAAAPDHLDYQISDYAQSFVAEAVQRYRDDPHVSACRLDLETDFDDQGVTAGSMDAVIAANVLHATADLAAVLKRLHRVLAPGGSLLIVELTRPRPWLDLTFGLTPGWWRFADDRTVAGHALLDRAAWLVLLETAGFEAAVSPVPEELGQDMIIARKPRADNGWRWSVTGAGALRDAVADEVTVRTMASGAETDVRRGVIHLVVDGDAAVVAEDALNAARQVLAEGSERLVLVTMHAQAVGPGDPPVRHNQAAAFGVARSLALENPDLAVVTIDVNEGLDMGGMAAALYDAAAAVDGEDERAVRDTRHYVPRLVPAAASLPLSDAGMVWRIAVDRGRFVANAASIPVPRCDEIVVRVHYAALNFLDVLEVTDTLPFARTEGPGEECVGVVIAVGPGVKAHRVGDRVMGIVRGAMASHVAAPAVLMVSAPENVASRDAATAPVAYATAVHALRDIAGLTSADRVLVHSGASGTGLAAVHYALSIGATVYATASPAKWPMLRALGVAWTGSSRTPDFATALRDAGLSADIVLNSLTGQGFVAASLDCLAHGGRLVELAKRDIWTADAVAARRPDLHYSVVDLYRLARERPAAVGALLADTAEMMRESRIVPLPSRTFPVDEAAAAVTAMRHGAHVGKIVLDCREGTGFTGADAGALDPDARYLITGAFGGLGSATADWMVDRGARILMLAGRRIDARAHAVQRRLAARGCQVELVETDLANPAAARALAEQASADGRLRGAIHAPGILADGSIVNLTPAQIAAVMGPKVAGAQAMAECWIDGGAGSALDFFVLFSSAASLIGSPGQANHAAANAVLDAAAAVWRARGLRTISINWGAWSHIGSARDAQAFVTSRGMHSITPHAGLAALDWALRHDHPQLGVVPIDWTRWHQSNRRRPVFADLVNTGEAVGESTSRPGAGVLRAALAEAIPSERRHQLHAYARHVVAEALGHGEATLDFDRGFTDLGVDSLTAIAIRNRLQRDLDCVLGTTFLFDYPNIAVLVDTLDVLIAAETPSASDELSDLASRLQASLDELDLPA